MPLDRLLINLDAGQLRLLASCARDLTRILQAEAERKEKIARVWNQAPIPLDRVPPWLRENCALARARQAKKERDARRRALRNALILRLAERGWSNRRIAERVKLHPVSISRIVQKQLGLAAPLLPPDQPAVDSDQAPIPG